MKESNCWFRSKYPSLIQANVTLCPDRCGQHPFSLTLCYSRSLCSTTAVVQSCNPKVCTPAGRVSVLLLLGAAYTSTQATCIPAPSRQLLHAGSASLPMRQSLASLQQRRKRELHFRSAGNRQHISPQAAAGSTGASSGATSNSIASATTRNSEASTPAVQQAANQHGQAHEQGKCPAISNLIPGLCAAAAA